MGSRQIVEPSSRPPLALGSLIIHWPSSATTQMSTSRPRRRPICAKNSADSISEHRRRRRSRALGCRRCRSRRTVSSRARETDGCPVLSEGCVKPDALTLSEDQPGPPLAVAVSGDNFRDGIEPCSIGIGVGGSRKHHGEITDVLARGPRCEPLAPTGVQLFKLDAPVGPVLPSTNGLSTKHFHPVATARIFPRSLQRRFCPPRSAAVSWPPQAPTRKRAATSATHRTNGEPAVSSA